MSAKRLSFLLLIVLLNLVAKLIFTDSNVLHFGGNNASTSVGELGYSLARSRYEGVIFDVFEAEVVEAFIGTALTAILRRKSLQAAGVLTVFNPFGTQLG